MIELNGKGRAKYEIGNKINLILTSNNLNPFPMGERERRLLPIQIGDELIGNVEFWDYFHDYIVNRPSACRVLYDYYNDVEKFNLNEWNDKDIPQTELAEILQEASKDPLEEIILEIVNTLEEDTLEEYTFRPIDLLSKINNKLGERKLGLMNSVQLGLKLSKNTFCKKLFNKSPNRKIGTVYSINKETLFELKSCQIKDIDLEDSKEDNVDWNECY
jgi:hypothetical protein